MTSGKVTGRQYQRRRRIEFVDFMNRVAAEHPDRELHVILDNLNTHKPKNDRWLKRRHVVYAWHDRLLSPDGVAAAGLFELADELAAMARDEVGILPRRLPLKVSAATASKRRFQCIICIDINSHCIAVTTNTWANKDKKGLVGGHRDRRTTPF